MMYFQEQRMQSGMMKVVRSTRRTLIPSDSDHVVQVEGREPAAQLGELVFRRRRVEASVKRAGDGHRRQGYEQSPDLQYPVAVEKQADEGTDGRNDHGQREDRVS